MKYLILMLLISGLCLPIFVFAAQEESDQTKIYLVDSKGQTLSSFNPFDEDYRGSMDIAVADLGGDGISEIIVGAGVGLPPSVQILRQDGTSIVSFFAYSQAFTGGINIDACDTDGDTKTEIITGAGYSGGPHVRIFDTQGNLESEFFAYDASFRGGVFISCADIDGDGISEIVTGAGVTGGPHIKVFSSNGEMLYETFAGTATDPTGATVRGIDLDGDGDDEIITARAGYGDTTVMAFDIKNNKLTFVLSLNAFNDYQSGTNLFAVDVDGDGMEEIGTSMRGGNQSLFNAFEMTGAKSTSIGIFSDQRDRGLAVDVILDEDQPTYVVGTTEPMVAGDGVEQYILVDLTDQTLRAFENGSLLKSFLVSTGISGYSTPLGKTQVTAKLLWHDYTWYYGVGDSRNYDIPDVKYNLRFRNHYYLHYAYWHNNFGNRMSHGCVNIGYEDVEWVYNWASVGATVEVVN